MVTFIIWDVSPVFVDLGFFQIRWYSIFFALGFVLSYIILNRRFKKVGLEQKYLDKLTTYVFGLFFTLVFVARILIEFVKADQSAFEAGMILNMGRLLSIPFIILGVTIMLIKRKKDKSDLQITI